MDDEGVLVFVNGLYGAPQINVLGVVVRGGRGRGEGGRIAEDADAVRRDHIIGEPLAVNMEAHPWGEVGKVAGLVLSRQDDVGPDVSSV